MQSILKLFSDHGTFVLPDALTYIFSKEHPDDFAAFLVKNLREYPLFLALDTIKDIEASTQQLIETPMTIPPPQTPAPPLPPVEKTIEKEFQKKMLSKIYNKPSFPKEINEEEDEEDTEEETQPEEKKPLQPLDIKTVKSWKPLARDYDSEVRILNDITGKRTSEGTTLDFVSLFRERYQAIRKILTTQRREISQFIPINRIKKTMVDVQLIGIVKNVKTTHNGHRLIEIEDDTGSATLMALKSNTEIMQLANEVMLDEVIGVVGKISKNKDLIIVQNIIYPDIKMHQDTKRIRIPPLRCIPLRRPHRQ